MWLSKAASTWRGLHQAPRTPGIPISASTAPSGSSLVVQLVRTSPSSPGGAVLILDQRAKIPHASGPKKPKHRRYIATNSMRE